MDVTVLEADTAFIAVTPASAVDVTEEDPEIPKTRRPEAVAVDVTVLVPTPDTTKPEAPAASSNDTSHLP